MTNQLIICLESAGNCSYRELAKLLPVVHARCDFEIIFSPNLFMHFNISCGKEAQR